MAGALTIGQLMFFYSLLGYLLEPLERLASVNLQAPGRAGRRGPALPGPGPRGGAARAEHQKADVPGGPRRHRAAGRRLPLRLPRERAGKGDLRIPAGKTVAIVGESGSGKSTLLKLLMGFYAPTEGSSSSTAWTCGTSTWPRCGPDRPRRPGPVHLQRHAAREHRPGPAGGDAGGGDRGGPRRGLEEFIAGLPERYETVIGERGANLSGGQRQRLAIARALLRQPDVLIFDEATSHLDTATERAIQENLKTALAGKTVVLVAHRLSTIRDADLIYVLHQGRVAEAGTHRAVAGARGAVRAPWRAQADEGDRNQHRSRPWVRLASRRNGNVGWKERAMRNALILDLADCTEFRQTLLAAPAAVVHGTLVLLVALLGAALPGQP